VDPAIRRFVDASSRNPRSPTRTTTDMTDSITAPPPATHVAAIRHDDASPRGGQTKNVTPQSSAMIPPS
jgi:hypothetical protein